MHEHESGLMTNTSILCMDRKEFYSIYDVQSLNPGNNSVERGLNICRGDGGNNRLLVLLKNLIQILPEKQN